MKSWPNVASKQLQSRKKYNKNIETLLSKQFFPPYLRQAAKSYVATSHSMVRQETIEISEQRTVFVGFFALEVGWCMKDCDKQRLQTTVSINLWKSLAGHTGDWFDVKTASICTTELWEALKSFILTSLKFKVAPYPIIVSLHTLNLFLRRSKKNRGVYLKLFISLWALFWKTHGFSLSRLVFDFLNLDVSARITHAVLRRKMRIPYFSLAPCLCKEAGLHLVSAWNDLNPHTLVSGTLRETFAILAWPFAALRITPEPT